MADAKRLKANVNRVGGALDGIVNEDSKMLQIYWMFSKHLPFRWRTELAKKL